MEKKHFVKIVASLVTILLKMTLCLCIYFVFTKNSIIISLFKIDTLNFTCTFNDFDIPLKNIRHWITKSNFSKHFIQHFFFIIVKRQTNKLQK